MTRGRAYVALGNSGGSGGGDDPPPVWPKGWTWPPPPYPPGYGGATYLGTTYKATTYTISLTINTTATLVVADYDDEYDLYEGTTFSVTVTGGGYKALYLLMPEDVALNAVTSLDLSATELTEVYLDLMVGVTTLDVSGNASLTTIDFSNMANLVTIDAGQCGITGAFSASGFTSLTTVDVADNAITSVDFSGSTVLATIDVSGNTITSFDFTGTAVTTLNLTAFTTATTVDVTNCTALTSLDVNAISTLTSVTLTGCTALTTLDGSSTTYTGWDLTGLSALTTIDLSSNTLSSGQVDTILSVVEAFGTSNGTLDLCTNSAPGASGEADKTTLEGRGWTVCTDSPYSYGVYPQYNAERGTAFNLILQALDENGDPLTSYTPTESLTVSLNSTDGSDTYTVTTVDTTGWTNGSKTVSGTISGGSGDDTATIDVVEDNMTGSSGTFNIKDTLAANPAQWRVTLLNDATITSYEYPPPNPATCDSDTCALVTHTFTGTYSNLVSGNNVLQTYSNTAMSTFDVCTDDTDAAIQVESGTMYLSLIHPVWYTSFVRRIGYQDNNSPSFDRSSWQTQRITMTRLVFDMVDCVSPANPVLIVEATA